MSELVKPLTARMARYVTCNVPDRGAGEALQEIRAGRHTVIDTAELERLRADVRRYREALETIRDWPYHSPMRAEVLALARTTLAAQQEQSDV